jgi:hypothetical protein
LNLTLIINILAVVAMAVATKITGGPYAMASLALGFGAGIAVTIASRYAINIETHSERGALALYERFRPDEPDQAQSGGH